MMSAKVPELQTVTFPDKLKFLVGDYRYKVAYGGRGGAKSWGVATYLVLRACQKTELILCVRELQKSIKDSSHRLLKKTIERLGLTRAFDITKTSIKHILNGSEFIFEGIRDNIQAIKSAEGISICWIEEAQFMTEESYEILTPTIREDKSEVIITFNPDYEDDATFQKFVIDPPENAAVQLINYYDNPWFPEVLEIERQQDKARMDSDAYGHKWLGQCKGSGGKVYPTFSTTTHVREFPKDLIRDRADCFMAMDPHQHFYPFCMWMAIIKVRDRGRWPEDYHKHFYAEWPTYDDLGGWYFDMRKKLYYQGTVKEMATQLYAKDGLEYGYQIKQRFIDSRFARGSGSWSWASGTTGIIDQFSKPENGSMLFNCPAEKLIDAQRQAIITDLEYNKLAPVSDFNCPSVSFDPVCRNAIKSFQNHKLEASSEKESEKYKDPCDVARILYAGINGFRPQPKRAVREHHGVDQRHRQSGLIPRGTR